MSALSIATNVLSNAVQLNLDRNQAQLQNVVTQLSSGLRINTAADDPSGNAIATNLTSQYEAFNQASQNVQNANNASQVALSALTQQTDILQRIRVLSVEAASDINSTADRVNLQAEVSQLLLEVNRISQNTNFNGQALLDGTHAGYQPGANAYFTITANAAISNGFLIVSASPSFSNAFNTTPNAAYPGIQGLGNGSGQGEATVDGTIELQVVNTGVSIAVKETFFESATGLVCTSLTLFGPSAVKSTAFGLHPQNITAKFTSNFSGFDNVAITLGAVTTADVGTTAYIKVSQNVGPTNVASEPAFSFQSGADEGDVVQIGIAATNTNTLRLSNINLAASTNPSLAAEDAIGQVDIALQQLTTQQANLGAIVVRLGIDQQNDDTAAVNLQSSESNIADLNVGQASTEFTKLQLLVQVGTSVLSQSNSNAQTVLTLFR
ncbi:MAG: flagellin [Candidatus Aquilonibacter sp.]